jgi:predicted kinase
MVIIVFGLPGSGKSFFATRLAKDIQAEYVNSDRVRKKMFPASTYSKAEKDAVYEEMRRLMNEAIAKSKDIVLDATFHSEAIRKRFQNDIQDKSPLKFIEVTAKKKIVRERLSKPRAFSEADFKVYKKLKQEWEPFNEEHLVLESSDNNIEDMIMDAEAYLALDYESK